MGSDLLQISDLLRHIHNFDISRYDVTFLKKSLSSRMQETRINSLEDYGDLIKKNVNEGKCFIDSLNISFSLFFRNSFTFSVLEHLVLPRLILYNKSNKRKEIRIWSVACAAGQESYSLAILLEEAKNGANEKINYRIFASDHSELQVNEAQKGVYSSEEIGNLSLKRMQKWFTKQGDNYMIRQDLKQNIEYSVFDLFNEQLDSPPDSIFGDFDLVFCANLLFYYKKEYQKILLNKASNCIVNGGYLVTGETEREILLRNNFVEVFPQSAIFRIPDCL